MKIFNERNEKLIASKVMMANNPWSRLKGLLFTKELPEGEGMLLTPCNSVHTIGMTYAIDIIFLDKKNKVRKIIENMKPNCLSPIDLRSFSVLELPANHIKKTDVQIGDQLRLNKS